MNIYRSSISMCDSEIIIVVLRQNASGQLKQETEREAIFYLVCARESDGLTN